MSASTGVHETGPLASALEDEVKGELRRNGIVVWLDKDGAYSRFVDRLAERHAADDFFAPVVAFRGSFLEMTLALEPYGNGLDPEPLLLHLPGYNHETVRQTPLLELYRAGKRFERALPTLVREVASGQAAPDAIESLLAGDGLSLERAEEWLAAQTLRQRGGLAAVLEGLELRWILEGLVVGKREVLRNKITSAEDLETLVEHLYRHTGMDEEFSRFFLGTPPATFEDVTGAFAAWLLAVEYAHDLKRPPHLEELQRLRRLSPPLRKTCEELIEHFREHLPEWYVQLADSVEKRLAEELAAIAPEDLGRIDTFRSEETRILEAAVAALGRGDWARALDWAESRTVERCFWLRRDEHRRMAWTLVGGAARLGVAIESSGRAFEVAESLARAVEIYAGDPSTAPCGVDRCHRRFEQKCLELLGPKVPFFVELRAAADDLRRRYRRWADRLAGDFAALCDRHGFLPEPELRQRQVYDRKVHPLLAEGRRVVYFLVDALRYEMATELLPELEASGAEVRLEACLAELPTITPVGMNALAPLARRGQLEVAGAAGFTGFSSGEFQVKTPKDRVRAMALRSLAGDAEARLVDLGDVCSWPPERLKRGLGTARLVVVHSREIDEAGEIDVGLATFESWLQQLRSAWHRLKNLGLETFVFSADHGFLLQDAVTVTPRGFGTRRTPKRRWVESPHAEAAEGTVAVSFAALGYEGREGYLIFRRDTQIFDTGASPTSFAHGGNSPQERIVPVMTVSVRPRQRLGARYRIAARALPRRGELSRLRVVVERETDAQSVLEFAGSRTVDVALRVPDRDDVTIALKDVRGAERVSRELRLEVGKPADVLFELSGPRDERVRLELYHPDAEEQVTPLVLDTFFEVAGRAREPKPAPVGPPATEDWVDALGDVAVGRVFLHIREHGAITETELGQMLGSARHARRFALRFDDYVDKVPFAVRAENVGGVKRYVRGL